MSSPDFNAVIGGAGIQINGIKSLHSEKSKKKCSCISKTKNKKPDPKATEERIVDIAQRKMGNYEELWLEPKK